MPVHSRIELEFGNVGYCGEGKTGVPGEKPLGAEQRNNNKLNPHMTPCLGIEPGTRERRALSALRHLRSPIASIWRENMLGYLSLDIICSSKLTVFLELLENCSLLGTDNAQGQTFQHIILPIGGYCLFTDSPRTDISYPSL